ncbi:MAG: hypothetical protein R3E48_22405 [Burkholderiaceae bacterium]
MGSRFHLETIRNAASHGSAPWTRPSQPASSPRLPQRVDSLAALELEIDPERRMGESLELLLNFGFSPDAGSGHAPTGTIRLESMVRVRLPGARRSALAPPQDWHFEAAERWQSALDPECARWTVAQFSCELPGRAERLDLLPMLEDLRRRELVDESDWLAFAECRVF